MTITPVTTTPGPMRPPDFIPLPGPIGNDGVVPPWLKVAHDDRDWDSVRPPDWDTGYPIP